MPRLAKVAPVEESSKNVLKDELRERMLISVFGDDYKEREQSIAKILHDKLDFFNGMDISILVPESHDIINKYAGYILDFKVKISLLNIKNTIDDLGNSLGGIGTEQKLKIALDRIKGTLANKYVNIKSPDDIERDKLIGILRMIHEPNTRSAEYKKKNKNIIMLLDKCLEIIRSNKKFSVDQFKQYLRAIPNGMLLSELQKFIVDNR